MTSDDNRYPDFIFEISWEVCNKIGGIYTVLATKAARIQEKFGDNYILIGPDVWKETRENPDFLEDKTLFPAWRERADAEGIKCRIGRWNIPTQPIAILVDFTPLFSLKDSVFAEFWETYELDSITGHWDYIEPALFGYAAGKLIESFAHNHLNAHDQAVAHFHEWMTGMGVLYLRKYAPYLGTVFTTHATVLGRSIAGHGMPLYQDMGGFKPDAMASSLGVRSKYSLELLSARHADSFTTVSDLTAKECGYFLGKMPDLITPNGFDESYMPDPGEAGRKRTIARESLLKVARAATGQVLPEDAMLVLTSGRYEFRNKGLDVLLDAMAIMQARSHQDRPLVIFFMVPANQTGPNPVLAARLNSQTVEDEYLPEILTHHLHDASHDPIYSRLVQMGLSETGRNGLYALFTPAYLNGADGIYGLDYYELLAGFDLSVFPSYYEPWGYTPMESLAYGVPAITTSMTGFGRWMENLHPGLGNALHVVLREEGKDAEVALRLADIIYQHLQMEDAVRASASLQAFELSHSARWSKLVVHYHEAYDIALKDVGSRRPDYTGLPRPLVRERSFDFAHERPMWKKILVNLKVPKSVQGLERLSTNLWWTWNSSARALFERIDPDKWAETEGNPVALLESLSVQDYQRLSEDEDFKRQMNQVLADFDAYMGAKPAAIKPRVAYFSMEFGLHDSIKIYSGGLGVLAGDYLKEASDNNLDMIGVGLLYRYGYFKQAISLTGDQVAESRAQKFSHLPVVPVRNKDGHWVMVRLALPGRTMHAKVWRCDVGRIPLYLMDTDIEENEEQDKVVTHHLYGGDWDNRFKQELLLGVGGIRLLESIGIKPDIYHCNEGHAAFTGVERLRRCVQDRGMSFPQAMEIVRATTLFTTHTPVPAGHDYFSEDVIRTYIPHYADRLNLSWNEFLDLGRFYPGNSSEKFSMSVLAARLSQSMNGVSAIHGRVSREMFRTLYPGYFTEEIHIGHVTNGVHYPTWTGRKWRQLHEDRLASNFTYRQDDTSLWSRIHDVPDKEIWDLRCYYRSRLLKYLRNRVGQDMTRRQESPGLILKTMETMNEQTLTLGFARRFATYKRAHLLFTNLNRLAEILNKPGQDVQIFFAGKAHPSDKAGQDLIKRIIEISRLPQFAGKIVFIENYDLELGRRMVQGVDVWLNTPTRPLEASGTSGEKAVMNGVLNFSVLDGWWAEGYQEGAGWAIKEERTYQNQEFQDQLDAETIYNTLEETIIPMFYQRNQEGLPEEWIQNIKNTIAFVAPRFTMKRMLDDYVHQYYQPMYRRAARLRADGYALVKEIAEWKQEMRRQWNSLEVLSVGIPDATVRPLELGEGFEAEVIIRPNGFNEDDLGVEVLFGNKDTSGEVDEIILTKELKGFREKDGNLHYTCSFPIGKAGVYDFAFRLFPKHPELPHRQDFPLVRWI